ncbi:MAG TPA: PIN domain-containing protein [Rhodanobacteraceae bacterium]|jgi:predicted nucleic acid-binding protein|nr:PIN domain-containing protein [Rhodanobacteraceae bacterium]
MKIALDTNVLAYAEGVNDTRRRDAALEIVSGLPQDSICVPVQSLGELFHVLVRKAGREASAARDAVLGWRDAFALIETSPAVLLAAMDLAADHELAIWDAIIVAAAAQAGCRLLLSEDLQDGFTWNGVTVANPFAARRHVLLEAMLGDANT